MSSSTDSDSLLIAYVYGELSASAAQAFEARLQTDPDLQAEVDGLMATRDLLDADVAFADSSGADEPPAHLFDAIIKAEALSRPPEIRQAIVLAARPEPEPLLKRLTIWLLGGGAAMGAAAAAVLFVVYQGDALQSPESPMAVSSQAQPVAKTAAQKKSASRKPALKNPALNEALLAEDEAALPADSPQGPEERKAQNAPQQVGSLALDSLLGSNKDAYSVPQTKGTASDPSPLTGSLAGMEKAKAKSRSDGSRRQRSARANPPMAQKMAAPALPAPSLGTATPAPMSPPPVKARKEKASWLSFDADAESDVDKAAFSDDAQEKLSTRSFSSGSAGGRTARSGSAGAGGLAKTDSLSTGRVSIETDEFGPRADSKKADSKRIAARPKLSKAGPPPLPKGAKEIFARGRFGKAKRAKRKLSQKNPNLGKKLRLRESTLSDAHKVQNQRAGQETLIAAAHQLSIGKPGRALLLFVRAEKLTKDATRTGVTAVVGQMRSLEEMRRFSDALESMPKILKAKAGTPGRVDGLLLGARCAENLRDFKTARKYLRVLMKTPGEGQTAAKALKRLKQKEAEKNLRRAADSQATDTGANAAAAAQAAPAASRK